MQEDVNIRSISPEDIYQYIKLCELIDSETNNMLYEAGERNCLFEKQKQQIIKIIDDNKSKIWIAENKNHELIGYLMAIGNHLLKTQHSTYIVIGILKQYTHKRIGTKLFEELNKWAINNKIHRLELTVRTENTAAIDLYKKMGFVQEGVKIHSLLINFKYEDELYMSKIF